MDPAGDASPRSTARDHALPKHTRAEELYRYAQLPPIRNTVEAAEAGHETRLQRTRQGRALLIQMGRTVSLLPPIPPEVPPWEDIVVVDPKRVPRNMGHAYPQRRATFARQHVATTPADVEHVYTDVAVDLYHTGGSLAYHALRFGRTDAILVTAPNTAEAMDPVDLELRVIAWAVERVSESTEAAVLWVYTDSQAAL